MAAVAVTEPKKIAASGFLLKSEISEAWPKQTPLVQLPLWKRKDACFEKYLRHKVIIAHCPTGSGKSTILPALAAMKLHPKAGRVCCTQIRRATAQTVCRDAKDVWGIERDSKVIGF